MSGLQVRFDVIIDDGLHSSKAQVATLKNFFPYLASGGIYITEDLYDSRGKTMPQRFIREAEKYFQDCGASIRKTLVGGTGSKLHPNNVSLFVVERLGPLGKD